MLASRVIYAKEVTADGARVGIVTESPDDDAWEQGNSGAEIHGELVEADVIHVKEVKASWIDADEIHAQEVNLGG